MANIITPRMFGQQPSGQFADGLVFYWRGKPAGNVVDESLNRNHGTLIGSPTWVGQGLDFNGSSDYIELDRNPWNGNITSLTIICRFFPRPGGNLFYITQWVQGGNDQVIIRDDGSGIDVFLATTTSSTGADFAGTTIVYDVWHTLAVVWDGADVVVYLDNAKSSTTLVKTGSLLENPVAKPWIGRYAAANWFDGIISHTIFYNRVLTASEIAALSLNPDLPMQQPPIWLFSPPPVVGVIPKGPLGHPFHGPFGGPVAA